MRLNWRRQRQDMTPQDFIDKWRQVELKERTTAQTHFNDLCRLLGVPDPISADPTGDWFTKRVCTGHC